MKECKILGLKANLDRAERTLGGEALGPEGGSLGRSLGGALLSVGADPNAPPCLFLACLAPNAPALPELPSVFQAYAGLEFVGHIRPSITAGPCWRGWAEDGAPHPQSRLSLSL